MRRETPFRKHADGLSGARGRDRPVDLGGVDVVTHKRVALRRNLEMWCPPGRLEFAIISPITSLKPPTRPIPGASLPALWRLAEVRRPSMSI